MRRLSRIKVERQYNLYSQPPVTYLVRYYREAAVEVRMQLHTPAVTTVFNSVAWVPAIRGIGRPQSFLNTLDQLEATHATEQHL